MDNYWDFLWTSFSIFALAAYLLLLFSIIPDLFRDRGLNGWYKALWVIFLIWLPYLAVLVYLIARGQGMAERHAEAAEARKEAASNYVRDVVSSSGPASEIARAKQLLTDGVISDEEFNALKAKAIAN